MAEPQAHRPYSLRRLLSLLNSLVAASGVILIGLGVGIKYGEAALTRVLGPASTYHLHISHLCLGLGCLAVLLALVGWCIAKKESRGSLLFFLVTMAVILVVEITVASVVLAFFPVLKCSGVNNYTDFPSSSFSMVTGHSYPRGCCKSLGAMACDGHNVSSSVIHQAVTGDFAMRNLNRP
ncbi:Tetraspanin-16 [Heterocephalus glaber]|uniref:Tetraspanin-16 n=1 Tax=Heterocephalus glaber TaxID=10181 RepID=G5BUI9_HETGA|nr:Tetraspanin-16 [Heterocephalus glaber]